MRRVSIRLFKVGLLVMGLSFAEVVLRFSDTDNTLLKFSQRRPRPAVAAAGFIDPSIYIYSQKSEKCKGGLEKNFLSRQRKGLDPLYILLKSLCI